VTFNVPTRLETERLLLREFRHDDWRDLHAYYGDAQATRYTQGRAHSESETWRLMCTLAGHWLIRGYGPYAVEQKTSGKVLGTVGFWYPEEWPEPEIKWALARGHWGQGYAREAAAAVHQAGKTHLPEIQLISLIHADNRASVAVAEAIGASFERTIEFKQKPHAIYRHR